MDLIPERVTECHLCQGSTTAWVMDDVGYHSLEIPIALAEIKTAKTRGPLTVVSVRLEHRSRSLTLCSDHTTHFSLSLSLDWCGAERLKYGVKARVLF